MSRLESEAEVFLIRVRTNGPLAGFVGVGVDWGLPVYPSRLQQVRPVLKSVVQRGSRNGPGNNAKRQRLARRVRETGRGEAENHAGVGRDKVGGEAQARR